MAEEALQECLDFCNLQSNSTFVCIDSCLEEDGYEITSIPSSGIPLSVSISVAAVLICLSALFSGLTLGLLSLDIFALKVLSKAGEPKEQEYAKKIMPIRKNGNWLLATLLLGNTIVNNGFSILLADITSGIVALIVSVGLVLIFGEITPQAICARHGLYIGAHTTWLVKFFMVIFAPIAWPISWVLNKLLGTDIGTIYSKDELKRLIELHATDPKAIEESGLTIDDHRLLIGALEYKEKRVKDVMTTLDNCFMLDAALRLNFDVILAIYKSGFTRIPIYQGSKHNIVGILYSKDLILVDPEDELEIQTVMNFRGRFGGHIYDDLTLQNAFQIFLQGNNHMLIAHKYPLTDAAAEAGRGDEGGGGGGGGGGSTSTAITTTTTTTTTTMRGNGNNTALDLPEVESTEVTGLITLEDVLEELIQMEIVDETDMWEDQNSRHPKSGRRTKRQEVRNIDAFLSMLDDRMKGQTQLSSQETQAVTAFLAASIEEFSVIGKNNAVLRGLLRSGRVVELEEASEDEDDTGSVHSEYLDNELGRTKSKRFNPWEEHEETVRRNPETLLYTKGQKSDEFVLILSGRVSVRTGQEGFTFELGPWSVLGNRALVDPGYAADFDAVAVPPCRLLKIDRASYSAAMRAMRVSVVLENHQMRREIKSAMALTDHVEKEEEGSSEGAGEGGGGGGDLSSQQSPR